MGDTKAKPFELKQFIKRRRDGQMQRVGVMYAQILPRVDKDSQTGEIIVLPGGEVTLGFSLCSKTDEFCPYVAEEIAFNRSLAYIERAPYVVETIDGFEVVTKSHIPDSIKTDLAVFIGRAERFFDNPKSEARYKLPTWASRFYADHQELVEIFFKKLAEKKAVNMAVEAIVNG